MRNRLIIFDLPDSQTMEIDDRELYKSNKLAYRRALESYFSSQLIKKEMNI